MKQPEPLAQARGFKAPCELKAMPLLSLSFYALVVKGGFFQAGSAQDTRGVSSGPQPGESLFSRSHCHCTASQFYLSQQLPSATSVGEVHKHPMQINSTSTVAAVSLLDFGETQCDTLLYEGSSYCHELGTVCHRVGTT